MKLDATQEAALTIVRQARMLERNAAIDLRAEMEAQLKAKMAQLKIDTSIAANKARALKISVRRIGEALGTQDWNTIQGVLNRVEFDTSSATLKDFNVTDTELIVNWVDLPSGRVDGPWVLPITDTGLQSIDAIDAVLYNSKEDTAWSLDKVKEWIDAVDSETGS